MKTAYKKKKFMHNSLLMIAQCNEILEQYAKDGYDMTLRQLYYQLVRRNAIENKKESYDNLGVLMTEARLSGYVDWSHLVDRGRNLKGLGHFENPQERIQAASEGYHIDKWADQQYRIEVWVEKEALAGVFNRSCTELDINYFACKGYTSISEMYRAGRRLRYYMDNGQIPVILHFGDHDPSGLDMSRDITDRLSMFMGTDFEVDRRALNMDQIRKYQPPPNYAKITDTRFKVYQMEYGDESWELDALNPDTLNQMVTDAALELRDDVKWQAAVEREAYDIGKLHQIGTRYHWIAMQLDINFPDDKATSASFEKCRHDVCTAATDPENGHTYYCREHDEWPYCQEDVCLNKVDEHDVKLYCDLHSDLEENDDE